MLQHIQKHSSCRPCSHLGGSVKKDRKQSAACCAILSGKRIYTMMETQQTPLTIMGLIGFCWCLPCNRSGTIVILEFLFLWRNRKPEITTVLTNTFPIYPQNVILGWEYFHSNLLDLSLKMKTMSWLVFMDNSSSLYLISYIFLHIISDNKDNGIHIEKLKLCIWPELNVYKGRMKHGSIDDHFLIPFYSVFI